MKIHIVCCKNDYEYADIVQLLKLRGRWVVQSVKHRLSLSSGQDFKVMRSSPHAGLQAH